MTNLETLDLSSNRISGGIPSGLCQGTTTRLKELYLQNNWFTSPIPPTLSNCSQLVSLDLSFNYLTGKIPSTFWYLSKLQDLIIWFNELEGEILQELIVKIMCSSSTVTVTPPKPNFFPTSLSPAVPRRQWISSGPSVKHIDHCRLFEELDSTASTSCNLLSFLRYSQIFSACS
ncbi:hypothetical protein L2E82_20624 [Cichorium intybus]|uniref:Uncharacterized protein n=1 Tax=Cichorium intybus TaxID=13427 RepID=A0ACB9DTU8_CICIN|nr:hypothetical protein L2E82_20624 [Cichorium intybus]